MFLLGRKDHVGSFAVTIRIGGKPVEGEVVMRRAFHWMKPPKTFTITRATAVCAPGSMNPAN